MSEANTEQEIVEELKKRLAWLESQLKERASYAHPSESHTLTRFDGAITELKHVIEFIEKRTAIRSLHLPSGEGDDRVTNEELRIICIENADEVRRLQGELATRDTALRELAEVTERMKKQVRHFSGCPGYYEIDKCNCGKDAVLVEFADWLSRHRSLLDGAPKKEGT